MRAGDDGPNDLTAEEDWAEALSRLPGWAGKLPARVWLLVTPGGPFGPFITRAHAERFALVAMGGPPRPLPPAEPGGRVRLPFDLRDGLRFEPLAPAPDGLELWACNRCGVAGYTSEPKLRRGIAGLGGVAGNLPEIEQDATIKCGCNNGGILLPVLDPAAHLRTLHGRKCRWAVSKGFTHRGSAPDFIRRALADTRIPGAFGAL